jgi:hypothetical protein
VIKVQVFTIEAGGREMYVKPLIMYSLEQSLKLRIIGEPVFKGQCFLIVTLILSKIDFYQVVV